MRTSNIDIFRSFAAQINLTTTYTTTTTFVRFAPDNDALRRAVAVAIRRDRRDRRGYKKSSEAAKRGLTLLFNNVSDVQVCTILALLVRQRRENNGNKSETCSS